MKNVIVTSGEIAGRKGTLPDRNIVREAQRNLCLSAAFWTRIKEGKIPYIFNREKSNLEEAGYADAMASLKSTSIDAVYWLTDKEYPQVNETLQNIANIEVMKKSYQQQINQYKQ
jgi:hypothetical protein